MKYFSALKTSERISLSFSIFGFLSLLLFLILINITYFFIWHAEQKNMSFSGMNESYVNYLESEGELQDIENFKQYLLSRDTLIIPEMGELVCSPGVAKKIHESPEKIQDKYIYRDGDTIYFIYSKYFEGVGDVRVFFDTTPYINSQLIIIKIGLIFIFFVSILQFFMGRYISRRLLRDLTSISEKVKNVDINFHKKHIICSNMPEDDEIRILAEALNSSYDVIEYQTGKLKQFLTDVSHEFKTPLMVLSSRLDLLDKKKDKKVLQDEDVTKFFGDTRKNIKKLNGLLESLFFLSRIEEESSCIVKKQLRVKEYLENKILTIAERFPEKKLSYSLDIQDDLEYSVEENTFSILGDNLISNAMKFSPKNMHINISANEKGLSIKDNGIGISKQDQEKIWDKFYRKDTNKEGFGVGLYLVKRIVDIYEWKISVHSKGETGTIFKVDIS